MKQPAIVSKILSGWKTTLFFLVVASLLAIKYNHFYPKKFSASAEIKSGAVEMQNVPQTYVDKMNPFTQTSSYDEASVKAVEKVIEKQQFNVEYYETQLFMKKGLYKYSPIKVKYSLKNKQFTSQEFNLKFTGADNFLLSYEYGGIKRERTGVFGTEMHEMELNFTVIKNPEMIPSKIESYATKQIQFIIYSDRALAEKLLEKSVSIASTNGMSSVTVTNTIPEKAMLLANGISEALSTSSNPENSVEIMDEQLAKAAQSLDEAQAAVAKYKTANNITDIPMQADAQLSHLENLEMQKMNLDLESMALNNLSDYLRKNRVDGNAVPEFGTITDPVFSGYITRLNENLLELKNNAGNTALSNEINYLKSTIAEGIRNTRKKVALQQDEINRQIAITKHSFTTIPGKEKDLETLNRNLYLADKLYNYLVDKRTVAMYNTTMPVIQNNIVRKAVMPRKSINAEAGMVWTIAILMALACATVVNVVFGKSKVQKISNRKIIDSNKTIPFFASIDNGMPKNIAEQFKNICTKMLLLREQDEKQIVTVTSAAAGDGKTFVATQLAKSLASLDLKVLVLDMNLTNQSVENLFDAKTNYTLADVLKQQTSLQDAIQITAIPYLDILIAGELTQGISNLIAKNKLNHIFGELKKHYDFIIVDTTNTTNAIDAIPLMKMSDFTFYVVKSGAEAASIFETTDQIKNDYKIDNISFILNKIQTHTNHLGVTMAHKMRVIHKDDEGDQNQPARESHSFLKRAALWFY